VRDFASRSLFEFNRILEKVVRRGKTTDTSQYSPIFIVGLPRSGTTFFYQSIVDQFELGYLHNHFNYLYGYPTTPKPYDRIRKPDSYQSNYGYVKGWNSPSEHFGIWRGLFGTPVSTGSVATANDLNPNEIIRTQNVIHSLQNLTSGSYIFKCLYLDLCISALAEIFPQSRFIYLRRDFDAVRDSMVKARSRHATEDWWSVKVPGWENVAHRSLDEKVDFQLSSLRGILDEQINKLEEKRVYTLNFEEFCLNIDSCITDLSGWLGDVGVQRRRSAESLANMVR